MLAAVVNASAEQKKQTVEVRSGSRAGSRLEPTQRSRKGGAVESRGANDLNHVYHEKVDRRLAGAVESWSS